MPSIDLHTELSHATAVDSLTTRVCNKVHDDCHYRVGIASDLEQLAARQQHDIWALQTRQGVSAVLTAQPSQASTASVDAHTHAAAHQASLYNCGVATEGGINASLHGLGFPHSMGHESGCKMDVGVETLSGTSRGQRVKRRHAAGTQSSHMRLSTGGDDGACTGLQDGGGCGEASREASCEGEASCSSGLEAVRRAHQLRIQGIEQAHRRHGEQLEARHQAAMQEQVCCELLASARLAVRGGHTAIFCSHWITLMQWPNHC